MLQDCIFHRYQQGGSEMSVMAAVEAERSADNAGGWPERNETPGETNYVMEGEHGWG